jgi:hypothetical protein
VVRRAKVLKKKHLNANKLRIRINSVKKRSFAEKTQHSSKIWGRERRGEYPRNPPSLVACTQFLAVAVVIELAFIKAKSVESSRPALSPRFALQDRRFLRHNAAAKSDVLTEGSAVSANPCLFFSSPIV